MARKRFIIAKADETQVVECVDGYDGWDIIGGHTGRIPEAAAWDAEEKRLGECPRTRDLRQRQSKARNHDQLLDRIEALEEAGVAAAELISALTRRVETLEAQVAKE